MPLAAPPFLRATARAIGAGGVGALCLSLCPAVGPLHTNARREIR